MKRHALLVVFLAGCASLLIPACVSAPPAPRALPPPPYVLFSGQSFEPSAAAFDPPTRHVLVLSDRDTTLYRYELGASGLTLPPGEYHQPLRFPQGVQAAKLEALTRLPSGAFLATTAFDRPDSSFRRVFRFTYTPGAPAEAVPVAVNDAALAAAVRNASGLPWFKIEALAVDPAGTKVLFGVRNVGESYKAPRDVALVVRCPLSENGVGAPEAVIPLSTAEALGGHVEGLSDLQLDPAGDSFLALTSHEETDDTPKGHSGHLFRIPAAVLLGAAAPARVPLGAPLREFRAKPEGLAVTPSGALVVVFDDDRNWKRLFAGYDQADGLFTVIDPGP